MSLDPYAPYGPLVDTTMRVVTWNVWGRYGDWQARQAMIDETLQGAAPDVVCLTESWCSGDTSQPKLIAERLGLEHSLFDGDWKQEDWVSGFGLISRWPIRNHERLTLRGDDDEPWMGSALLATLEGDRGIIQLFGAMLSPPLDGSVIRQAQVRQLAGFIKERTRRRHPTVLCGDFNAGPDADEIRMLTGRCATAAPGLVFYDAWEIAGDGTPGNTWSNYNPLAAMSMYPDRRFDYILSAWPRAGAVGHPTHCELLGVQPADQPQLSDHYGVLADLRY